MENAFKILGADPTNTAEQLNEILEDKQLLLDDSTKEQAAYTELCNPKKRLKHEITYLLDDSFWDLIKIAEKSYDISNNDDAYWKDGKLVRNTSNQVTIGVLAKKIADTGKYFEVDCDEFLDDINGYREDSGYPQIDDRFIIVSAFEEIKAAYKTEVVNYLDRLTDQTIVSLFNEVVKIPDFHSFFIDDLMAYYELKMSSKLEENQSTCNTKFRRIKSTITNFNSGNTLSSSIESEISDFLSCLKEWDNIAQPLQVNMQIQGVAHEDSDAFIRDLRNDLIDLINKSQESLGSTLESSRYLYNGRERVARKLHDSVFLLDKIIVLLDGFTKVFAEMDQTAERLKKDKTDILNLKREINMAISTVDPYGRYKPYRSTPTTTKTSSTQTTTNKPTTNYNQSNPSSSSKNGYRILIGIVAAVCWVLMIVGFSIENTAMGIAFIILGLAFSIGCGAFYIIKDNRKALIAIILVPIILILSVVVPVASCSGTFEGELTTSNFERAFNVSGYAGEYGASFTITPKESGYAKCSRSSREITVTVVARYTGGSAGNKTFRKTVKLQKTNGYSTSGKIDVSGFFTFSGSSISIESVSGSVYLE